MATDPSVQQFLRSADARLTALRRSLSDFLHHIALEDKGAKAKAARDLNAAVEHLLTILDTQDQPHWLRQLHRDASEYRSRQDRSDQGATFLQSYARIAKDIPESWPRGTSEPVSIDAAEIFKSLFAASDATKLFDILIGQLQDLLSQDRIDSRQVYRALQALLATIKKNYQGDLLSVLVAVSAAQATVTGSIGQVVSVAAPDFAADTTRTVEEIHAQMASVTAEVKKRVQEELLTRASLIELPSLALPAPPKK